MNPRLGVVVVLIVVLAFSATFGPYGIVAGDNAQPSPTGTLGDTSPMPHRTTSGATLTNGPPTTAGPTATQTLATTQSPTSRPTPESETSTATQGVWTVSEEGTLTERPASERPTTAPESLTRNPPGNNPVPTPPGGEISISAESCTRVVVDPGDADVDSIVVGVQNPRADDPAFAHNQFVVNDVDGPVAIEPRGETFTILTGITLYKGQAYADPDATAIVSVDLPCPRPTEDPVHGWETPYCYEDTTMATPVTVCN